MHTELYTLKKHILYTQGIGRQDRESHPVVVYCTGPVQDGSV